MFGAIETAMQNVPGLQDQGPKWEKGRAAWGPRVSC